MVLKLALAHKIQQMIDRGVVADQAAAAVKLGLTRARVSQLMDLTLLPVAKQEEILFLESVDGVEPVTEKGVRVADN